MYKKILKINNNFMILVVKHSKIIQQQKIRTISLEKGKQMKSLKKKTIALQRMKIVNHRYKSSTKRKKLKFQMKINKKTNNVKE